MPPGIIAPAVLLSVLVPSRPHPGRIFAEPSAGGIPPRERMASQPWTLQDSVELYLIDRWGAPYFTVNDRGHLVYRPDDGGTGEIDLKALVDDLRRRGIVAPVLVRFNDILKARIAHLHVAFAAAIEANRYAGAYRCVMPVKVNQQCHVIEQIVRHGEPFGLGLEAGSKPELLLAIAQLQGAGGLLVCNGYKDREYIETALFAQSLGQIPYLVLDRFAELSDIIACAKRCAIRPHIGMRAKLSSRGSGRWKESSGDASKFGLSAGELVDAVAALERADMLDCFELLHFHIGSQITAIKAVKEALNEAAYLYCELRRLGAQALHIVDCGGGLAVDYDGSRTNFHSSKNYSTQEYANDIVKTLQTICAGQQMPAPDIFTESGRALLAQHSVLLFNVMGTHSFADAEPVLAPDDQQGGTGGGQRNHDDSSVGHARAARPDDVTKDATRHDEEHVPHALPFEPKSIGIDILQRMQVVQDTVNQRNFQQAYNDIIEHKEHSISLFSHGLIDLRTRARAEKLFWSTCRRIQGIMRTAPFVPDDLRRLDRELRTTYFCNFSVFQSLPDAWAVGHLFPIVPIHRLGQKPHCDAILADLTCDSDGKIDKFIDLRDVRDTLRLHEPDGHPYYLGAFLVGAYQEILGDLHNLFGDTNAVHVSLDSAGNYTFEHLVEGDRVSEVLGYVKYDRHDMVRRVRRTSEAAVRAGRITPEQLGQFMKRYEEGLGGYTYLEDID